MNRFRIGVAVLAVSLATIVGGYGIMTTVKVLADEPKEAVVTPEPVVDFIPLPKTEAKFEATETPLFTQEPVEEEAEIEEDTQSETTTEEEATTLEDEETPTTDEPAYTYVIQRGDSFWSMSEQFYGDGKYCYYLAYKNDMGIRDLIVPGQTIEVYHLDEEVATEVLSSVQVQYSQAKSTTSTSSSAPAKDGMTYLGQYRITGYDPYCSHCCGKADGVTASGRKAEIGTTIACNSLPFGTWVYIEGYGYYRVDDTGNMSSKTIDIAASSHEACYALTRRGVNVYLVG